ncbi:response regulator transcription factor [Micromonospora endolithica]|uniref:DNA-binding response regulator n=1 Tax=Micromonospora endolithica TaxID=230091 RepID=A0A3A9Z278_9ACTN|nr:response regulator transcription factor [Micromonospora endolithica]RKN41516.1 DNA-binding response regulator [Micromonospora endolithica]TWJ21960.1 LuxR family two component transcriptional regulator [Micromonospora endolithica]
MIRVVVAEEMCLLRGALCAALSNEEDIEVVAEVTGVDEVSAAVRRHRPDVVLVDLAPDEPQPVEVVAGIVTATPGTAVLALGRQWSQTTVGELLAAGARGMVGTDASLAALVAAVRDVAGGARVIDATAAVSALSPPCSPLTRREAEVLRAAAGGLPVKEIARRLFLAHGTVRNHLSASMRKTGARNRMEAVWRARREGWI